MLVGTRISLASRREGRGHRDRHPMVGAGLAAGPSSAAELCKGEAPRATSSCAWNASATAEAPPPAPSSSPRRVAPLDGPAPAADPHPREVLLARPTAVASDRPAAIVRGIVRCDGHTRALTSSLCPDDSEQCWALKLKRSRPVPGLAQVQREIERRLLGENSGANQAGGSAALRLPQGGAHRHRPK